jgi:hypothetical protein
MALRLATWNVAWFSHLFDGSNRLRADGGRSGRFEITRADQAAAIAIVLTALDADAVMVIEAPDQGRRRSTVTALEGFARAFDLRCRAAVSGFASDTEQEIALLFDPDRLSARHDPQGMPGPGKAPRFDGTWHFDIDGDAVAEAIRFSKPPLELAVTARGRRLRLIGVHAKSKAPLGARTPAEATRIAIENRRKQLAECVWLRRRVDAHLAAGDSVIVLGDLNDGPGLDEFEKLFGRSGVEVVMGTDRPPEGRLHDPHAALLIAHPAGRIPATARFWQPDRDAPLDALLDYILVSSDLAALKPRWRIWHPHEDAGCRAVAELRDALLTASDHFPVSLDLPD